MGAFVRTCALSTVVIASVACGGDGPATNDASTGGGDDAPVVDGPPLDGNPNMPQTLQETGLCSDPACMTIAAEAKLYAPRYELWSDGATKRRWIQLPPGEKIDTTDMSYWTFPVGTKLWKEFTRGDVRVETRLLHKVMADDNAQGAWIMLTYAWNASQDAATLVANAGVMDANGTMHDIPSRQQCRECHNGVRPSRVLGFGAMSLDFDAPADHLDLADLVAQDLLTTAPAGSASPFFPVGGATATDMNALGYMHANCGHCHNPSNPNNAVELDLRLRTEAALRTSVMATPGYATTVDKMGSIVVEGPNSYDTIIEPGMPDQSIVIRRLLSTNPAIRMPRLGTEIVDPDGEAKLRTWIEGL